MAWKQPDVLVEAHDGAINQGADPDTAHRLAFRRLAAENTA